MLKGLNRDRSTATLFLAGLMVLMGLVVGDFGVGLPQFPKPSSPSESALAPISEIQLIELLATNPVPALHTTNLNNPFFTTHFQPPNPPAPTTRKVNMTYQGFFQTTDGDKHAFVRVDDANLMVALGRPVIADLVVSEINARTLTLTNSAAHTNLLEFLQSLTVEVPVP